MSKQAHDIGHTKRRNAEKIATKKRTDTNKLARELVHRGLASELIIEGPRDRGNTLQLIRQKHGE